MIRLERAAIPPKLKRRAAAGTPKLWEAWRTGQTPVANPGIYNDPEVKRTLCEPYNKCAYCETPNPSSHEVVEHYRPWDGWRQQRGDALQPGYFWLAYEWENLLFACDVCNDQGHKGNLFPLADPTIRATPDRPDLADEEPLLLNPYGPLDPEEHIAWDRDVPKAHPGSACGAATIDVLGLDRDGRRADFRRAHLNRIEKTLERVEALGADHPVRPDAKAELLECLDSDKPWAAMIRANLGARIRGL